MSGFAYRRDASWRNSFGVSSKYHMPHRDDPARSACGSYALHEHLMAVPSSLPDSKKCSRSGCRQAFAAQTEREAS